jgi:hypothetical protein
LAIKAVRRIRAAIRHDRDERIRFLLGLPQARGAVCCAKPPYAVLFSLSMRHMRPRRQRRIR